MPPATVAASPALQTSDAPVKQSEEAKLPPIFCLSHLRWNFVYQRPQHLLSRFATVCPVYFMEEPVFEDGANPHLRVSSPAANLTVLVPVLPHGLSEEAVLEGQRDLLDTFIDEHGLHKIIGWYYTPMALRFSDHVKFQAVVFDCMDELSAFAFAPPQLLELEQRLLDRADVVFTGGRSIFNAKKHRHGNVHCFPSSIDKEHFAKARVNLPQPDDQAPIPHPRFGFAGVIDERFDIELLRAVAEQKPEWQFILLGPVVKIDPATLPQGRNLHYLGPKAYADLPAYFQTWDIATILFALNESTKFISPTKTPEYLAAGKPVISTPITDVIDPYGQNALVEIAGSAAEFIAAGERLLAATKEQRLEWLADVDEFLKDISWQVTFSQMLDHIQQVLPKAESQS